MQTLEKPQRTIDNFTTGIVNLPIVLRNGKPVKHHDSKKNKDKYDVVPDMRYPYFELDRMDKLPSIIKAYANINLPVYVHRTMRGYHFLSTVAIHKDCYAEWIRPLMKYNPKCPMVTLRIIPNKWIGEKEVFYTGTIFDNNASDLAIRQLQDLKTMIENQDIANLSEKYYIVHYRMTGELGNL